MKFLLRIRFSPPLEEIDNHYHVLSSLSRIPPLLRVSRDTISYSGSRTPSSIFSVCSRTRKISTETRYASGRAENGRAEDRDNEPRELR